jgi:hypothetical protein
VELSGVEAHSMEKLTEYVYEANGRATMHSIACHERGHGRWYPRKRWREG